ncbi:hypothetical protein, partial [Klebsiella pneumoniae]|uniref:hypothetical protein n=1 Tax=Klebsiella pneumoniae TaxID=573 RepID=UPI003B980348
ADESSPPEPTIPAPQITPVTISSVESDAEVVSETSAEPPVAQEHLQTIQDIEEIPEAAESSANGDMHSDQTVSESDIKP